MQTNVDRPVENRLLAMLPGADRGRLVKRAERVRLGPGDVICDPGAPMAYAVFPLTNLLSSVVVMPDGEVVEAAVTGREGMAGIGLLLGLTASPHRVMQQVEGECLRIPAGDFEAALAESEPLRTLLERYALTLLQQVGQNVACGLSHPVPERLCRWLLESADRIGREEVEITQEFLAEMLGVRRQAINLTASALQEAGLITYQRGRITFRKRAGIEKSACECYRITRDMYERLMKAPAAATEH